jgi:hypothetical protein
MALTTQDLNNPARLWSYQVTNGTAPSTRTDILLYKIRNYKDGSSEIMAENHLNSWDLRCGVTNSVSSNVGNPKSYDVDSVSVYNKYTDALIATWNKGDFTDALAIFQNHTGTNGVNYSTWVAFTQAVLDSINKF